MDFRDIKESSAEILRVAGTLLLIYPLAILPFFIFGTGRSLSDFAMLGVIAVPVLGEPGRDNALLARVGTGQATFRLLFDCGEGCLWTLSVAEVHAVDALFFSHLHIDHVAGFDGFLRLNFARPDGPVLVFGPAGTTRAIHHRLRGVTWNLTAGQPGEFRITIILSDRYPSLTLSEFVRHVVVRKARVI